MDCVRFHSRDLTEVKPLLMELSKAIISVGPIAFCRLRADSCGPFRISTVKDKANQGGQYPEVRPH